MPSAPPPLRPLCAQSCELKAPMPTSCSKKKSPSHRSSPSGKLISYTQSGCTFFTWPLCHVLLVPYCASTHTRWTQVSVPGHCTRCRRMTLPNQSLMITQDRLLSKNMSTKLILCAGVTSILDQDVSPLSPRMRCSGTPRTKSMSNAGSRPLCAASKSTVIASVLKDDSDSRAGVRRASIS